MTDQLLTSMVAAAIVVACSVCFWIFARVSSNVDDLGDIPQTVLDLGENRVREEGQARTYLKVYETLPPQLLNAYGEATYCKLSDCEVWKQLSKPLKSGAMYMTEFCAASEERRGIAANRWLHAVVLYCHYQVTEGIKAENKALLNTQVFDELYTEIEKILPSLEYCLAPKKQSEKSGASSLRGTAVVSDGTKPKDASLLRQHAKVVYEWLDVGKVSLIRMLMQWQAAGGLSFVSSTHHRAAQCFRYYGNSEHEAGIKNEVSLAEFQDCIIKCHS